jgi:bifunctional DNA primase/polymerase-like protein
MSVADALAYTARPLPIFPCNRQKRPCVSGWQDKATIDAEEIGQWWKRWPDALPGMPTGKRSGLVVLDIDVKSAESFGFDTLADLGLAILPNTPLAHTRSGGLHV